MDDLEWNVNNEGLFLEAMVGHKPVGLNKHFQMACILDKFSESAQKDVSSDKLWNHLGTMYNLEMLDEGESIPFPNNEKEFELPEIEFGALMLKKDDDKKGTTSGTNNKGRETPKNIKETPTTKKEEKSQNINKNSNKEITRRDSKDSKTPATPKREIKTAPEKGKGKGKAGNTPNEGKGKGKFDDTPKPKRPTRGSLSLKSDDSNSSGKSSPVNLATTKRRRI